MLARVLGLHLEVLRPQVRLIERFRYEPITTVYLKYPPSVRLAQPMLALVDDAQARRYGQWLFDRGALDSANAGILAAVVSAGGPHEEEPLDQLCDAVAKQLAAALSLPQPIAARAIVERRATLAATPDLKRPTNSTPLRGLFLAGDWTESDYPSTLETAVRSGQAAARALLGT
jgi:predicted NAD/FAD-dependent oxidoreductase